MWDALWLNANLATMCDNDVPDGAPYGAIVDGAIGAQDGAITWVGARRDLPGRPAALARDVRDAGGGWVTPGLIDCHTHLVYGGSRAHEFEMRLQGASYEDIARAGGGIVSTVRATRAASEAELEASAAPRLASLLADGVTTVEIKSGYGLDRGTELKQLRVARRLGAANPLTVRTTFLGAHALPPEFAGRADDYVEFVCAEVMPAVAAEGVADAVDAYCEGIGFTPAQTRRVFEAARAHSLPVKLHADQFSDLEGAALVAEFGGLSADHLEYTTTAGVRAMAAAGTVAVLLPGAYYVLGETQLPPIEVLREHRVPMAVATDCNPGSAPLESLLLAVNMACILFRLTPEEALAGVTRHAARALGLGATHGTLECGKTADLAVWRIAEPAELAYRVGANRLVAVVRGGQPSGVLG